MSWFRGRSEAFIVAMGLVGACSTPDIGEAELVEALSDPTGLRSVATDVTWPERVRRVRCEPFEEEPTEFGCSFEGGYSTAWRPMDAVIVFHGGGWRLLDISGDRPGGDGLDALAR